jgi:8-oxo-dGTP pyrophosphatase MutT (NUDIX family)
MSQSQRQSPDAYPVSIKGVVVLNGRVLLLKNEREEWELPGGRIELGETPQQCVAREIAEETRITVTTGPILDSWMYYIAPADKHVLIVTYGCHPFGDATPVISHEHKQLGLFTPEQIPDLPMPTGYRQSISTWLRHLAIGTTMES